MSTLPGRLVLLGHPVAHSLSPTFQNAALRSAGLPLRYEAVDVPPAGLSETLTGLVAERAAGNVTVPHKEQVAARCDRLTPLATRVGAVNTFWIEDGVLAGDNTDVGGFLRLLATTAPDVDRARPVVVLGAGGAAAAVLAALEAAGFRDVAVHARTAFRAVTLCERFTRAWVLDDPEPLLRDAALLVNATPVGLDGNDAPIDVNRLAADAVVLDLIPRRGETPLVRAARAHGHRAADGLEMLLAQGALSFERWFGITPDWGAMRASVAR
ncbi:MAG: Shikimate dehydrogenase [Geminicoccaceae bacterium]|nr:Shikimate dehydrogenase [Geminicoccaceae bacterium]